MSYQSVPTFFFLTISNLNPKFFLKIKIKLPVTWNPHHFLFCLVLYRVHFVVAADQQEGGGRGAVPRVLQEVGVCQGEQLQHTRSFPGTVQHCQSPHHHLSPSVGPGSFLTGSGLSVTFKYFSPTPGNTVQIIKHLKTHYAI